MSSGSRAKRRKLELLVLSDIHLGTYGCKAKELLNYLRSVKPETLILNGDIIDFWQFSKHYFPKSHLKIIKVITTLLGRGTKVYYITGNHDELLRKFDGLVLGELHIVNQLLLELDGQKTWFFHGDVFDVTMEHSKWIAKLGGKGYDLLIIVNLLVNRVSRFLGFGRISLSKKVKESVKSAVKFVNNYEKTAAEVALKNGYQVVVCGHIHQPRIELVKDKKGREVRYLNSGDWVENLSALEYYKGEWKVYSYYDDPHLKKFSHLNKSKDPGLVHVEESDRAIFSKLVKEFKIQA